MRTPILLAALLPLAGCVAAPAPPAPVVATATPVRSSPTPAPLDWQDRPAMAGGWRYRRTADGSSAVFGPATGTAFRFDCAVAARRVALVAGPGPLVVRTSSVTRTLAPHPDGSVSVAARDPLLDAIAFSRGRFTVERPGAAPLVLPAHAEIGRVVEDCRR